MDAGLELSAAFFGEFEEGFGWFVGVGGREGVGDVVGGFELGGAAVGSLGTALATGHDGVIELFRRECC